MNTLSFRWCLFLTIICCTPFTARPQLISLKTAPVATGDQFLMFPSQRLGMGSVSIALDDPYLDPFVNPAKGARSSEAMIFCSPVYYSISEQNGMTRTLPFSGHFGYKHWFSSLSFTLQQMEAARSSLASPAFENYVRLSDKFDNNTYGYFSLGKRMPGNNSSIAGSVYWAKLNAIEGVDLLYARSSGIKQYGHLMDFRLAYLREIKRRHVLEAVILHNRYDMTHEVDYGWWERDWDPFLKNADYMPAQARVEKNLDRSRTWGLHLGYVFKPSDEDWHLGGILTGNWKTHPKIPNYELMNIPRDPGHSYAYNIGIGLAKSIEDEAAVGIDFIYEPVWSNTWAETIEPVQTRTGRTLPVGHKSIENHFRFSNGLVRFGFTAEGKEFGIQLGLQIRSIAYRLTQLNYIDESFRKQKENWLEWIPSWGIKIKKRFLQIQYIGRVIVGTGIPGILDSVFRPSGGRNWEDAAFADKGVNFLIAPSGELTLADAHVITHQLIISVPISSAPIR